MGRSSGSISREAISESDSDHVDSCVGNLRQLDALHPMKPRAAAAPGRTAVAAAPGRDRTGIVTEALRLETAAARRSPSGSTARAPARRVASGESNSRGPGPDQQLRRPAGPELAGGLSESSEYYDHNESQVGGGRGRIRACHPVSRTGIVTLRPGSL